MVWDDCFSMASKYVCIECRHVGNNKCHKHDDNVMVSWRWRGPKKNNLIAWRRISQGEWLWDRKAVARAEQKKSDKRAKFEQVMKRKRKELGYHNQQLKNT